MMILRFSFFLIWHWSIKNGANTDTREAIDVLFVHVYGKIECIKDLFNRPSQHKHKPNTPSETLSTVCHYR